MFLSQHIVFSKTCGLSHTCPKNRVHMKIQYLEKLTFVRAKSFRVCEELLDQSLGKIGDRNHLIWLSGEYLRLGQNSVK